MSTDDLRRATLDQITLLGHDRESVMRLATEKARQYEAGSTGPMFLRMHPDAHDRFIPEAVMTIHLPPLWLLRPCTIAAISTRISERCRSLTRKLKATSSATRPRSCGVSIPPFRARSDFLTNKIGRLQVRWFLEEDLTMSENLPAVRFINPPTLPKPFGYSQIVRVAADEQSISRGKSPSTPKTSSLATGTLPRRCARSSRTSNSPSRPLI